MGDAATGSLYEQVLRAAGGSLPTLPPPRPSASVVPWRRYHGRLEIFWVQRSQRVPFMPGWHAFPGGALVPEDAAVPLHGAPQGLAGGGEFAATVALEGEELGPDACPGVATTALRELLEETGILPLAGDAEGGDLGAARQAVTADPSAFAGVVAALSSPPDAGQLVYAGRWLTPPFAPRRFDNRFFLLEWPAERGAQPQVREGELAAGEWIEPASALRRWEAAEVLAAPPILHLLRVLAEDGPGEGLGRLRQPGPEADLGPMRRIEFRPGVILLPLRTATLPPATHTNAYLLGTGPCVLVDPGSTLPAENERLLAALRHAQQALGRSIEAIWLTHHHPDHVGGVEAVREAFAVPVLAHRETAERLAPQGIAVDGRLEPGSTQLLGEDFPVRVVATPGHARGHLAFLAEAHGSLLCGDLVSALSTIVIDPPEGHMGTYLDSLRRALELAPRTLFPAHGPVLAPAEPVLSRTLAHRREREEAVLVTWRRGARDPAVIVPTVYEDVPRAVWPLAERQVRAHLEHLHERGEI